MAKNPDATRTFSDVHEKSICKALNGRQNSNSGAGHFAKGDVVVPKASLLIEAKCSMSEKKSVSIKKEWIDKNKEEGFATGFYNQAVCVNFGPGTDNYYVINERLMKFLVEKLIQENG